MSSDEFPNRLKQLLTEKNLTQTELAKRLSISDRTINSYCQGRSAPSLSMLAKICQILNTSADYLIGTTDEFQTLDGKQAEVAEVADDILMIRRSYVSMTEKERELMKDLMRTITRE